MEDYSDDDGDFYEDEYSSYDSDLEFNEAHLSEEDCASYDSERSCDNEDSYVVKGPHGKIESSESGVPTALHSAYYLHDSLLGSEKLDDFYGHPTDSWCEGSNYIQSPCRAEKHSNTTYPPRQGSSYSRLHTPAPRSCSHYEMPSDYSHIKLPLFRGSIDVDEYLFWSLEVDNILDEISLSDSIKYQLVFQSLSGVAKLWWDGVQYHRLRQGLREVQSWTVMRALLQKEFHRDEYRHRMLQQLHNCVQGTRTIEDYADEFQLLALRSSVQENSRECVNSFLRGLKPEIAAITRTHQFSELCDVVLMALKVERRLQRQVARPSTKKTDLIGFNGIPQVKQHEPTFNFDLSMQEDSCKIHAQYTSQQSVQIGTLIISLEQPQLDQCLRSLPIAPMGLTTSCKPIKGVNDVAKSLTKYLHDQNVSPPDNSLAQETSGSLYQSTLHCGITITRRDSHGWLLTLGANKMSFTLLTLLNFCPEGNINLPLSRVQRTRDKPLGVTGFQEHPEEGTDAMVASYGQEYNVFPNLSEDMPFTDHEQYCEVRPVTPTAARQLTSMCIPTRSVEALENSKSWTNPLFEDVTPYYGLSERLESNEQCMDQIWDNPLFAFAKGDHIHVNPSPSTLETSFQNLAATSVFSTPQSKTRFRVRDNNILETTRKQLAPCDFKPTADTLCCMHSLLHSICHLTLPFNEPSLCRSANLPAHLFQLEADCPCLDTNGVLALIPEYTNFTTIQQENTIKVKPMHNKSFPWLLIKDGFYKYYHMNGD